MAKKRKVNAPVREKQKQQKEDADRRRLHELQNKAAADDRARKDRAAAIAKGLEDPGAPREPRPGYVETAKPMPKFASFGLTIAVLLGIAAVGFGIYFAFNHFQPEEDPKPWASYKDRIEVTANASGAPSRKYVYRDREVKHWVNGAGNSKVSSAEFEKIVSLSVRWLTAEDATTVVLAAASGHPEWKSKITPHAQKLMESTTSGDPDSRALRNKLKALAESEMPAETPVEAPVEPEPDS
ncbi:MAG: hypothetical protein ACI8UO_003596 [Verrucomicrobiales bacterium]|jgi:hypothetical protein